MLQQWFAALQKCVRTADFVHARRLVDADVVSFGTVAQIVRGQAALEAQQWRRVWPVIRDFTIDLDSLVWDASGDVAWAVTTWISTGLNEQGAPYERPGRATVVFRRRQGEWVAVHTHFSLAPPPQPSGLSAME